MRFEWSYKPSGLGLRDDGFSWQGSFRGDNFFFLRRSKDEPQRLTDFNFGGVGREERVKLFAEFIDSTGGVFDGNIVFVDIGRVDEDEGVVVSKFQELNALLQKAARLIGCTVHRSYRGIRDEKFDAVFELARSNQ